MPDMYNSIFALRLIYKYKCYIFKKQVFSFAYKRVKAHELFNNRMNERTIIDKVMALFSN